MTDSATSRDDPESNAMGGYGERYNRLSYTGEGILTPSDRDNRGEQQ
jgi:hypothetical protein